MGYQIRCRHCGKLALVSGIFNEGLVKEMIDKASDFLNVKANLIYSSSRHKPVAQARFMIIHALFYNSHLNLSKSDMGIILNRDHSTICHALVKIEDDLDTDVEFRENLKNLHLFLYGHLQFFVWTNKRKEILKIN